MTIETEERQLLRHEREVVDFDSKAVTYEYWTEWKRVVNGKVFNKGTCCCPRPLASRRECADSGHNKTPCRCACHRKPSKKALQETQ